MLDHQRVVPWAMPCSGRFLRPAFPGQERRLQANLITWNSCLSACESSSSAPAGVSWWRYMEKARKMGRTLYGNCNTCIYVENSMVYGNIIVYIYIYVTWGLAGQHGHIWCLPGEMLYHQGKWAPDGLNLDLATIICPNDQTWWHCFPSNLILVGNGTSLKAQEPSIFALNPSTFPAPKTSQYWNPTKLHL